MKSFLCGKMLLFAVLVHPTLCIHVEFGESHFWSYIRKFVLMFQTIKERNMWSCAYQPGKRLQLVFSVPATRMDVSKIDVWNYNRSLKVSLALDHGCKSGSGDGGLYAPPHFVQWGCSKRSFLSPLFGRSKKLLTFEKLLRATTAFKFPKFSSHLPTISTLFPKFYQNLKTNVFPHVYWTAKETSWF